MAIVATFRWVCLHLPAGAAVLGGNERKPRTCTRFPGYRGKTALESGPAGASSPFQFSRKPPGRCARLRRPIPGGAASDFPTAGLSIGLLQHLPQAGTPAANQSEACFVSSGQELRDQQPTVYFASGHNPSSAAGACLPSIDCPAVLGRRGGKIVFSKAGLGLIRVETQGTTGGLASRKLPSCSFNGGPLGRWPHCVGSAAFPRWIEFPWNCWVSRRPGRGVYLAGGYSVTIAKVFDIGPGTA